MTQGPKEKQMSTLVILQEAGALAEAKNKE
jgi:hypothetical protein